MRRLLGLWGGIKQTYPSPTRSEDHDAKLDALERDQRDIRARLRLLEIQGSPRGKPQ